MLGWVSFLAADMLGVSLGSWKGRRWWMWLPFALLWLLSPIAALAAQAFNYRCGEDYSEHLVEAATWIRIAAAALMALCAGFFGAVLFPRLPAAAFALSILLFIVTFIVAIVLSPGMFFGDCLPSAPPN